MFHVQSEMEAVVVSEPSIRTVLNPVTFQEDMHLSYDAEIQYKRKPRQLDDSLCSLRHRGVGEPVMITYHAGMRCYKQSRHVATSNEDNCIGGFFYTDGKPA